MPPPLTQLEDAQLLVAQLDTQLLDALSTAMTWRWGETASIFLNPCLYANLPMAMSAQPECAICTEEFTATDACTLNCGHAFHRSCILEACAKRVKRTTFYGVVLPCACPICRAPIETLTCLEADGTTVTEFPEDEAPAPVAAAAGFPDPDDESDEEFAAFDAYRNITLNIVRVDGMQLAFAPQDLRDNEVVVRAAVRQNGLALQFASPRLRADRGTVFEAVRRNGLALRFAAPELLTAMDPYMELIAMEAVMQNRDARQYLNPHLIAYVDNHFLV